MMVVLVVGLATAVVGAYAAYTLFQQIHVKKFEQDAMERFEAVKNGVKQCLDVMEDLSGFFAATRQVDRQQFALYVRPVLSRQRGFHALTWNLRVAGDQRGAFEQETAREFPGFRITERHAQGQMVPAQDRDEYIVVYYLEPFAGNEKAFGFDVRSDPQRLEAFERARDSGKTTLTPRILLVQETGELYGMLLVHPVYASGNTVQTIEERRSHLQGFIVGVIRFGDLVESAIAGLSKRGVSFWLHDLSAAHGETLLYHHVSRQRDADKEHDPSSFPANELFSVTSSFTVLDQQWQLTAVHHHDSSPGEQYVFFGIAVVPVTILIFTGLLLMFFMRVLHNEKDRMRWEATLMASEEQKRIIIEKAPFGIVVADGDGRIREFNSASERLFGYDKPEIIGKNLTELVPPALRDAHSAGFKSYLETGNKRILGLPPFEMEAVGKDGKIFPIRLAVDRVSMGSDFSFLGVIIDMTEEKRLLSELIRSEKMAALGNMVAGVAHEINTPLGVGITAASELADRIHAFETLLQREGISEEELAEHLSLSSRLLAMIQNNLDRAAELVRSFKSVSVIQSGDIVQTFQVKECVESAVTTLRRTIRNTRLAVVVECPADLEMQGYPNALFQIVTNLLSNSYMHGYAPDAAGQITMTFSKVKGFLHFYYDDDGVGMPDDVIKHIFEPFFLARPNRGGMGLGLHAVYNLVTHAMGGSISCSSSVGQGLQFLIRIPLGQPGA